MAKFRMKFNKKVSIARVVSKLAVTLFAIYIGGQVYGAVVGAMNCTYSAFYDGLSIVGITVRDAVVPSTSGYCNATGQALAGSTQTFNNVITGYTSTGILSVIALVGIASIVLEFVKFRL